MKSCPDCNRTFEDTMSFCLIDGSVLSAPFEPNATQLQSSSRRIEPRATEILYAAPGTTEEHLPPSVPEPLPQTVSSPAKPANSLRETVASRQKTAPAEVDQPPMSTIRAILPEYGSGPAQSERPQEHRQGSGNRMLIVIGLSALALVAIGAIIWLVERSSKQNPSPAAATAAPVKPGESKSPSNGQSLTEDISGAKIQMVVVPGGTFTMGSPDSDAERDKDEGPQSDVTVKSFELEKTEVTQAQFQAVMGRNPSSFKGADLPVDSVSWPDAEEFCRKLSKATGREYRLPTEAEWEYAARSGTKGSYPGQLERLAWYDANAGNHTHPVGQREPNQFGLYDMNGNVWEWCQSKYAPYPYRADDGREDLQGNDTRVMRGGSWRSPAKGCRSSYRRRVPPEDRTIGFRVALSAN